MAAEKLYRVINVDDILLIIDESTNPPTVFPTLCDASGDLEKKLGPTVDNKGGHLYYVSDSDIEEFERYTKGNK